ncbi:MAG: hypothetical protein H6508_07070 [Calditrichaeota bacterium]|nr:hypothetical protein [Calditrichota bacterium]MCB9366920.1 hypothetical protein [Calditrichota bacterium]
MSSLAGPFGPSSVRREYARRAQETDREFPSEVITVTHCGKLGDFIASLPVASWLYKTRSRKIHFVLARRFPLFEKAVTLLKLQEMTHEVTLADFPVADWEKGGRPYHHDPNAFGIPCVEYYSFGLRRTPRKLVPEYVAEEHGLGYDPEFRLKLGELERTDEVLLSDEFMRPEVSHAVPIDLSQDLLLNARRMAAARESHVCQSGMFHILDWAGVTPTAVYIYPHSANIMHFTLRLPEHNYRFVQRVVRLAQ